MSRKADKKSGGSWLMMLFALPFAGVGVGFLLFSIVPSLYEWQQMQHWVPVQAQLESADLHVSHGDDSTTYRADARYRYSVNGQEYGSDRVGIMSGADNIGSWQQERGSELRRQLAAAQPITVYVNPASPSEAIIYRDLRWGLLGFKMIFVVVFGGVGIGLIWAGWRSRGKAREREARSDLPLWQQEPDWANPVRAGSRTGFLALLFFAVLWNAISMPLLFIVPGEVRQGNTVALVGLLFPLVGAGFIVATAIAFQRYRRFGNAPLTLDPWPGAIGGQVGGSVVLRLPRASDLRVQVDLSCLRSYYTGSGKDRSRKESVKWQKQGIAELAPGNGGTRVSFCFDVPDNLPASEPADSDYHFWRLTLKAPLKGADLSLQYEIPVFPTGESSRERLALSDQHAEVQAQADAALEALLNMRQLPGGVELRFDYFRNALGKSLGVLFGGIFGGAGLFMWNSDAPFFMALIFTLVGGGIVLGCLYGLFNKLLVKLGERGIYTERYVLGVLLKKRFVAPGDIEKLVLVSRGSSQTGAKHTEHFAIDARLKSGGKVRVAESLNGRNIAEKALESLSLLSGIPC